MSKKMQVTSTYYWVVKCSAHVYWCPCSYIILQLWPWME